MIHFHNFIYGVSLFLIMGISAYTWFYKDRPGAKALLVVMALFVYWNFTSFLEITASGIERKLFWRNAQQISSFFIPFAVLFFVVSFMDDARLLRKVRYFAILPLVFVLLIYTNASHGLVRSGHTLLEITEGYEFLLVHGTLLGIINVNVNLMLFFVAIALLVLFYQRSYGSVRTQILFMIGAILSTLFLAVFNNTVLRAYNLYIMTSVFYTPGIVLLAFALFRYDFFEASPLSKAHLLKAIGQPLFVIDKQGKVVEYNEAAHILSRRLGAEVLSTERYMTDIIKEPIYVHLDNRRNQQNVQEMSFSDGVLEYHYSVKFHPIDSNGRYEGTIMLFEDITAKKEYELSLVERADMDQLTGILNRTTFQRRYELLPKHSRVMVLFDIDDFKKINDTYGHHTGDLVLNEMTNRLRTVVRSEDLLGRLGGEEFGLASHSISENEALKQAERIRKVIADTPFYCEDTTVKVTISVGLSVDSTGTRSFDSIRHEADKAMYAAKARGKNAVVTYDREALQKDKPTYPPGKGM